MTFQGVVTRFMTSRMLILREDDLPGRQSASLLDHAGASSGFPTAKIIETNCANNEHVSLVNPDRRAKKTD